MHRTISMELRNLGWCWTGLVLGGGAASVGTLLGACARRGWLCELATHFRAQYTAVLLISFPLLLAGGWVPGAVMTAVAALANVGLIIPLYLGRRVRATRGKPIRALLLNVFVLNRAYERVRRCIQAANPDLMVLIEVDRGWHDALRALAAAYPYGKAVPRSRGRGIMLLSRLPIDQVDLVYLGGARTPSIVAQLSHGGRRLTLIGTHPASPTTPFKARLRDRQLDDLAGMVSRCRGPLVVLGDLNTTSWAPSFQRLLRTTGLLDSRAGFGLQATWPAGAGVFRIPIDHCLVSTDVEVIERKVGPFVGSDHHPILVGFSIP